MKTHAITGSDGIRLIVDDHGDADAPSLIFTHGFAQCAHSWKRQYGSALKERFRLITPDLRGHGRSDKPHTTESYTEGWRWAGDIAAVIEHLELERPILLAWSYSGLAACDFVSLGSS